MNIFTNDDYRRIQAWLKANSIKDSEFATADSTAPNEDTVTIVHTVNGVSINYKIALSVLLNSALKQAVMEAITAQDINVTDMKVRGHLTIRLEDIIYNDSGDSLKEFLENLREEKINREGDDAISGNFTVGKTLTVNEKVKTPEVNIQDYKVYQSAEGLVVTDPVSDDGNIYLRHSTLEVDGDIKGNNISLTTTNIEANGWYIEKRVPVGESSIRATYTLKNVHGGTAGPSINLYKDTSIRSVWVGSAADEWNSETNTPVKYPVTESNKAALVIVYMTVSGDSPVYKYEVVHIEPETIITEAEFDKNRGLGVEDGVVYLKLDDDQDTVNYLSFRNGKLSAHGLEARVVRELGSINSPAGEATMWGEYKLHEGTEEDSTPADGSRWGEFKKEDAKRTKKVDDEVARIQAKVDEVNLATIKSAQDTAISTINNRETAVISNINTTTNTSLSKIANREQEVLSKTDAQLVTSNTPNLEGTNVQSNLTELSSKLGGEIKTGSATFVFTGNLNIFDNLNIKEGESFKITFTSDTLAGQRMYLTDQNNTPITDSEGNIILNQEYTITAKNTITKINVYLRSATTYGVVNAVLKTENNIEKNAEKLFELSRDLGQYPTLEPLALTPETTGKYINSNGEYVTAEGWNVGKVGAMALGNTYLLNMVSESNMVEGVALFVSRTYKKDASGAVIKTILTPLFRAMNTQIPSSGYVLFECGDNYEEVLVCYKPSLTTSLLQARWGFKASFATQLKNLRELVEMKADFNALYESLTAGNALNLVGKGNGTPMSFYHKYLENIVDGTAIIKKVEGSCVKWNQLIKNPNFTQKSDWNDGTISNNEISYNGYDWGGPKQSVSITKGHMMLAITSTKAIGDTECWVGLHYESTAKKWLTRVNTKEYSIATSIFTAPEADEIRITTTIANEEVKANMICLIDLTDIFTAGNEPTTVQEFYDWMDIHFGHHDLSKFDFDSGSIIPFKGEALQSKDAEGNVLGTRSIDALRKKYFPNGMNAAGSIKDELDLENKVAIQRLGVVDLGKKSWSKDRYGFVCYIIDRAILDTGTHKINNIMSAYYVYQYQLTDDKTYSFDFRSTIMWVKDTAYSEDVDAFKASLQGVQLVYELATPIITPIEESFLGTIPVENNGSMHLLPSNEEGMQTTAFDGEIAMNKDYVEVIDMLDEKYGNTQVVTIENWEM